MKTFDNNGKLLNEMTTENCCLRSSCGDNGHLTESHLRPG